MYFDVLKDLDLSFKVTIMYYLEEVTEHFDPKLIGRVRFKDNSCNIVSQRIENVDEMPGC